MSNAVDELVAAQAKQYQNNLDNWKTTRAPGALLVEQLKREQADQPENVLEEANRLIYGERAASYGPARKSFDRIALRWGDVLGVEVTAEQVVLCMIDLKMCREINSHQRDNLVDIAGYAGCFDKIERNL